MRFAMNNVGILPDLVLDLDGFTVVTGLNGTGKSTILKTIYSILDSSEFEFRKDEEAYFALFPILRRRNPDIFKKSPHTGQDSIRAYIESLHSFDDLTTSEKEIVEYVERLISGKEDENFHKTVLASDLKDEFQALSQFISEGSDSHANVILEHSGKERRMRVTHDDLDWTGDYMDLPGVAYYDTPFILDGFFDEFLGGHRSSIAQMVAFSRNPGIVAEAISDRRLEDFDRCIESVLPGDIVFNNNDSGFDYIQQGRKPIGVHNLAAGMKVFAILRKLIGNGYITKDFVMLLDEPEIHLHPQWQVVLAEALVILRKSVGCRILMTTHSPLLLRAIQAYSSIHGQDVRYYLLDKTADSIGDRADIVFRDLGSDPEPAYVSMSEAFDRAQDLFYGD